MYLIRRKTDNKFFANGTFYGIKNSRYCSEYKSKKECIKVMLEYRLLDTSKYEICSLVIKIVSCNSKEYENAIKNHKLHELSKLKKEYSRKINKLKKDLNKQESSLNENK